jgi:hypothetical protein
MVFVSFDEVKDEFATKKFTPVISFFLFIFFPLLHFITLNHTTQSLIFFLDLALFPTISKDLFVENKKYLKQKVAIYRNSSELQIFSTVNQSRTFKKAQKKMLKRHQITFIQFGWSHIQEGGCCNC